MSLLKAARTSQNLMIAEFKWNFDDTIVNTSGATVDFGKVSLAIVADVINLPPNSVVVGGEVIIETAFDTAGYDIKVGDAVDDDEYLASTDLKATGRTALVPTGYRNVAGNAIRLTIASDDVCTTGVATLRVQYMVSGRANEVQPH